ncbi:uncharacterized protein LOC124813802 [Hydra vulgaris]|uniref:uncharacterized protein LOC124813802 n=1 Tax=Hydra vulgaris TaxID=6087 RepID=UPI001F5F81BD|nr:homeobox-leucine zipper protein ATHB-12-like [Hydra vulgaris]
MRKLNSQKTTEENLKRLETFFLKNQYPDSNERHQIAKTLGMHPKKVHIWFGNRRSRWHSMKAEQLNGENKRLRKDQTSFENLQKPFKLIHSPQMLKPNVLDKLNKDKQFLGVSKEKYRKKIKKDKIEKDSNYGDNTDKIHYEFRMNKAVVKNQNTKLTNKQKLATIFTETSNFIKEHILHIAMADEISDQTYVNTVTTCEAKSIRQVKCCMEPIPLIIP